MSKPTLATKVLALTVSLGLAVAFIAWRAWGGGRSDPSPTPVDSTAPLQPVGIKPPSEVRHFGGSKSMVPIVGPDDVPPDNGNPTEGQDPSR